MNLFDFGGLRLDNAFRFVWRLDTLDNVDAHPVIGDSVASYILKPKVNRWTVFWNNSADDIGTVILTAFMATPVCLLISLLFRFCHDITS